MRPPEYTKSIIPAQPGFYAIQLCEDPEQPDRPSLFVIPVVAWVMFMDEDGDAFCNVGVTIEEGVRDPMILTPAGSVHDGGSSYDSLENYVTLGLAVGNAETPALSAAAVQHMLAVEVPRIRAMCRLPEWPAR